MYLKPNGDVFNAKYKFLQTETDAYYADPSNKLAYQNLFGYITALNEGDVEIASAMSLISRLGKDSILATYNNAVRHEKDSKRHKITLTTAHS